jgi:hypothetical protein
MELLVIRPDDVARGARARVRERKGKVLSPNPKPKANYGKSKNQIDRVRRF